MTGSLNNMDSLDEFRAASLILSLSQERSTSTINHTAGRHRWEFKQRPKPANEIAKSSGLTSLASTAGTTPSPNSSDSEGFQAGNTPGTPEQENLILSPPLSPESDSGAENPSILVKSWSYDSVQPLEQSYFDSPIDQAMRPGANETGCESRRGSPYLQHCATGSSTRIQEFVRRDDILEDIILKAGNSRIEAGLGSKGLHTRTGVQEARPDSSDTAENRHVLSPLWQTSKRRPLHGCEPMEPMVSSSFCTPRNSQRSTAFDATDIAVGHNGYYPFPTLSPLHYRTDESNPNVTAKPPRSLLTSTPAPGKLQVLAIPIDLRCIACGSVSTPCWRPSWSTGKLCNSCGLRYARNRVRCSNISCSYIPTKANISNKRWAKCKKCKSLLQLGHINAEVDRISPTHILKVTTDRLEVPQHAHYTQPQTF